jgi:hypothetical protein
VVTVSLATQPENSCPLAAMLLPLWDRSISRYAVVQYWHRRVAVDCTLPATYAGFVMYRPHPIEYASEAPAGLVTVSFAPPALTFIESWPAGRTKRVTWAALRADAATEAVGVCAASATPAVPAASSVAKVAASTAVRPRKRVRSIMFMQVSLLCSG